MIPLHKPLLNLTAADLMSPASVLVPEEMSLQGAARLLSHAQVSGAPVVNAEGYCVGVLSTTDFLHWAERGHALAQPGAAPGTSVCSAWQIVDTESLPVDAVCHYMTRDPVTVTPGTQLGELARMMLDAHIHRVMVLDRDDRPVGVISTTDILAAVVRADAARLATGQPERAAHHACPT
jgi:CBS domain-containing protein